MYQPRDVTPERIRRRHIGRQVAGQRTKDKLQVRNTFIKMFIIKNVSNQYIGGHWKACLGNDT